MKLENEFRVDVPVEQAWRVLPVATSSLASLRIS